MGGGADVREWKSLSWIQFQDSIHPGANNNKHVSKVANLFEQPTVSFWSWNCHARDSWGTAAVVLAIPINLCVYLNGAEGDTIDWNGFDCDTKTIVGGSEAEVGAQRTKCNNNTKWFITKHKREEDKKYKAEEQKVGPKKTSFSLLVLLLVGCM